LSCKDVVRQISNKSEANIAGITIQAGNWRSLFIKDDIFVLQASYVILA